MTQKTAKETKINVVDAREKELEMLRVDMGKSYDIIARQTFQLWGKTLALRKHISALYVLLVGAIVAIAVIGLM